MSPLANGNSLMIPGEQPANPQAPEGPGFAGSVALGRAATSSYEASTWADHFDDWGDDLDSPNATEHLAHEPEPEDPFIDVPPAEKPGVFREDAPLFSDQVSDITRTNPITYVSGVRDSLSAKTENTGHTEVTLTEHETLQRLQDFLVKVADGKKGTVIGHQAEAMLSDLTFIGGREYAKAAEAMAVNWRERLSADPELQLCVVTGKIMAGETKSDAYLLDTILKNFTDDDVERFKDRLVFNLEDITVRPGRTAVIVLDDWVISGGHMGGVADTIRRQHPEYLPGMEVQLIAASDSLIEKGLLVGYSSYNHKKVRQDYVPVNAYYRARPARTERGVRITGATCAVDYGFNDVMPALSEAIGEDMPPGTNIVRPYRSGNVELTQVDRFLPR